MRISKKASWAMVVLLANSNAYAESYLFPTDIVDQGKFDIQAGIQKQTYRQDFEIYLGPFTGFGKRDTTLVTERADIRYGIANGWHVSVGLEHDSVARRETDDRPGGAFDIAKTTFNDSGARNIQLGVRHALIGDNHSPFQLTAGMKLGIDSATDNMTTLSPEVIAGWRPNDNLKLFAGYQGFFSDQDEVSDRSGFLLGLHKKLTERLTLIPTVSYSYLESARKHFTTVVGHREQYTLSLAAHWQFMPNTYLIPAFGFGKLSPYTATSFVSYDQSSNANFYAINLYHLF